MRSERTSGDSRCFAVGRWLSSAAPEISVAEPQNCGAPTRGAVARVRVGRVDGLTVDPLMSHFTPSVVACGSM